MDKITKVQEVSSFIVNFDNKYWNEVILRLTIIGIRYVTNNYRSIFSWKLKDLNFILDKLSKTKQQKKNNLKAKSKNKEKKETKKETKKEKNNSHCRNNSTITTTKNKENISSIKEKKNINTTSSFVDLNEINFNDNNEDNNNMLLLSERNNMENNKYYQRIKKNKEDIIYLNNKGGNNNVMSLKQNSFNYHKNKINVVMSDFPFNKENKIDKYAKNRNNFIFDFTQEQKAPINLDNLENTVKEEKVNYNLDNHTYISDRINKAYKEFHTFENKNKNPKFLEDITLIQKYNCKNSSQEFISELRKMNHSKDIVKNNPKKLLVSSNTNNTFYSQPKLNLSYNSSFIENKNIPNKSYINNINNINNNLSINKAKDKFDKMSKIKYNLLLKNNEYKKAIDNENKEKPISKTINNKYNFIATNDNLEINFQYGLNNIDINNINSITEKNPIRLNTNKYLKNPKKEIKINPSPDISVKNKLKMNFDYTFNKEITNSLNLENENSAPNTDRYTSKYLNEIQSKTNKSIINNNNSLSISRDIIKEETKEKESEKKEDKTNENKN